MTTSEDYPPPVVLDTTVLSCFASSEDLHLLEALRIHCVTVEAVVEELRTGIDRGHDCLTPAIEAVKVITVDGSPGPMLEGLDHGEAHALYAAFQREGTIVTDVGPARDRAADLDVPVTGSIGLLIRLVRQERISVDEADAIHHHWVTDDADEIIVVCYIGEPRFRLLECLRRMKEQATRPFQQWLEDTKNGPANLRPTSDGFR